VSTKRIRPDAGFLAKADVKLSSNGLRLCRYCQSEIPAKHVPINYCSSECLHEWKIRSDPSYARQQVLKRDKGVCAACNLDCEKIIRIAKKLQRRLVGYNRHRFTTTQRRLDSLLAKWPKLGKGGRYSGQFRSLWQADHIVPVIEGGGECGLDNYRTLCTPCHHKETAALARRRAAKAAKTREENVFEHYGTEESVDLSGSGVLTPEIIEETCLRLVNAGGQIEPDYRAPGECRTRTHKPKVTE
jgi:5-methylcytosine-specific restriction protein A